jgi:hypothetical protein
MSLLLQNTLHHSFSTSLTTPPSSTDNFDTKTSNTNDFDVSLVDPRILDGTWDDEPSEADIQISEKMVAQLNKVEITTDIAEIIDAEDLLDAGLQHQLEAEDAHVTHDDTK